MEKEAIQLALENQRKFFKTGKTFDPDYRVEMLKKLRALIIQYEPEIREALWKDFHKPAFEVIATETGFIMKEINMAIRKLQKMVAVKKSTDPSCALSFVQLYNASALRSGACDLSPWNYPFQLAFMPMIGALAAGNCVVLKVSRQVPHITAVMEKILARFPKEMVLMMNGDHSVSEYLLSYKFDYIFFTGSSKTGKYVMQKAAENLIPVSLELGGKNPCVVAGDARLDYAAKRIAWGKFLNAGQTCICTDYVLVDKKVKDRFLELIAERNQILLRGRSAEKQ